MEINNSKRPKKIQQLVTQAKAPPFVAKAPVVVVACAKLNGPIMVCGQPCFVIDVAIALDHLSLAAVEYGVGSVGLVFLMEIRQRKFLVFQNTYVSLL
jgi:hypothetical protein